MKKIFQKITFGNIVLKLIIILLILIPIIFWKDFSIHIYSHFSGTILPQVITSQWHIVILNIIIFLTFLIPLSFRRKINWKEYGLVTAFFISLFVEMYGIPLTIFFVSKSIYSSEISTASIVYEFTFLGVGIAMDLAMLYATILMIIGTFLILIAWITLYKKIKTNRLVTSGIYNISRHPQYLGFILIILGWFIGWPTLLTAIFTPILIYKYINVCIAEENELSYDTDYHKYKEKVSFLI